jgi:hypothetical protein
VIVDGLLRIWRNSKTAVNHHGNVNDHVINTAAGNYLDNGYPQFKIPRYV